MNFIFEKKFINVFIKALICCAAVFLLVISSYNHELWRDEGHYIQIAKELSFYQLVTHSRVEGLIPTHPIILKLLFSLFENKIYALKFFNITLYSITFYILLKSKTPFYIIILFMLSYPIFYYGIVNRYYIMLFPPIAYLILFDGKNNLLKQFAFFVLSICGIFGLFFLFSYLIANLKETIKDLLRNKIIYFLIFGVCCFSFFYYTFPYDGRNWNNIQLNHSYFIFKTWYKFLFAQGYIHNIFKDFNIATSISIPFYLSSFLAIISTTILYLSILTLYLKKEFSLLIILLSTLIIYLLFFSITSHHSIRHYFIFSIILYLINIKSLFINKNNFNFSEIKIFNIFNIFKYFLLFIMLIFIIGSGFKFFDKITKIDVSSFYIILIYIFLVLTVQNLYFKKKYFLIISLTTIFFIYLFLFSTRINQTYGNFFIFMNILFLVNVYSFFINKEKNNFFKLKILERYNIQKYMITFVLLVSTIGTFSYAIKETKNIYSNSKNLANYINENKIECGEINSYYAWEIGAWLPYIHEKNCRVSQVITKKTSGFWDLNFWTYLNSKYLTYQKEFFLDLKKYDFTKKKYTVFICSDKNCKNEEKIIKKTLNDLKINHSINLFDKKTLGKNGEKLLLLNILGKS
jgi:hypothetical protein